MELTFRTKHLEPLKQQLSHNYGVGVGMGKEYSTNEQNGRIFVSFITFKDLVTQFWLAICRLRALALMTRKHMNVLPKRMKYFSFLDLQNKPSTVITAL